MKKIFLITCCLFLGINISLSEMVSQREMVMGVQLEGEKFIDSKCPIRKANHSFNEVVFEVNAPSGGNNNSVNISFTLKNEVNTVSLRIADLYGNNIKTLLDNKVLNKESFTFIENRLQSGFYVIHLNIDGKVHTSIIKI